MSGILYSVLILLTAAFVLPQDSTVSSDSTSRTAPKKKSKFRVVVIDAGHGGKDPGAIGTNGTREKDVTLGIAKKLGALIEKDIPSVRVAYTRTDDTFVELYRRGDIANKQKGNLFISIHCNSTPEKPSTARGTATYILRPGRTDAAIKVAARENAVIEFESNKKRYDALSDIDFILTSMRSSSDVRFSEKFAALAQREMKKHCGLKSNGVEQAGFYVLIGAAMPSVLVETAFISNPDEEEILASDEGQMKFAKALFDAVKEFKKIYENS